MQQAINDVVEKLEGINTSKYISEIRNAMFVQYGPEPTTDSEVYSLMYGHLRRYRYPEDVFDFCIQTEVSTLMKHIDLAIGHTEKCTTDMVHYSYGVHVELTKNIRMPYGPNNIASIEKSEIHVARMNYVGSLLNNEDISKMALCSAISMTEAQLKHVLENDLVHPRHALVGDSYSKTGKWKTSRHSVIAHQDKYFIFLDGVHDQFFMDWLSEHRNSKLLKSYISTVQHMIKCNKQVGVLFLSKPDAIKLLRYTLRNMHRFHVVYGEAYDPFLNSATTVGLYNCMETMGASTITIDSSSPYKNKGSTYLYSRKVRDTPNKHEIKLFNMRYKVWKKRYKDAVLSIVDTNNKKYRLITAHMIHDGTRRNQLEYQLHCAINTYTKYKNSDSN